MGVMKIGNIVPRAGLERTSLAFRASVLPLHHTGSLCGSLPQRSVQTTTVLALSIY